MSHCNTDKFNYFWICEPLARCAKRGSSLPLGTPMEIDFTSAYLHYPLPQCSKIVTPIIFSISYELFRLPSAKVPQDYQLLRTFVWCLMEKLTRNNGPFLDILTSEKTFFDSRCLFSIWKQILRMFQQSLIRRPQTSSQIFLENQIQMRRKRKPNQVISDISKPLEPN